MKSDWSTDTWFSANHELCLVCDVVPVILFVIHLGGLFLWPGKNKTSTTKATKKTTSPLLSCFSLSTEPILQSLLRPCSGLRCISAFLLRNVPKCCPLAAGPDRCWGPWWAGERVGSGTSLFWRIFLNRLTTEVPTISVEQKHVRIEDCDSQWQIS